MKALMVIAYRIGKVVGVMQAWRLKLAERTLAEIEYKWGFDEVHTNKARKRYQNRKARLERVIALVRYNLGLQEGDES